MADDQDKEQKTEEPTPKKLEEAFKKGNVPFSREVTSFLMLAVLTVTISWAAPGILRDARMLLTPFLANADELPTDRKNVGSFLLYATVGGLSAISVPLLCAIIAAIAASVLQNGVLISAEPMMPKLEKISPIAGLKRMFSMRSIVEFLKGITKITIVGVIAFLAVYPELIHLRQLPNSTTEATLIFLGSLAVKMMIGILVAMFFIALFDLLFQRWQHTKQLRMSKQEIKDEYKQSEGDPAIKQRLRQLRQERARKRMMAAIPTADVVITNPTHFAIALQYDTEVMRAPQVVAKGQDLIALRIREIAEENRVPIVQNPPLAQALFKSTDIGEEIPIVHYEAVAKIISYVYQLKGKKPTAPAAKRA